MTNLLTVNEVAERLDVTRATVYNYCDKYDLPYIELPGGRRFKPEDIEDWLKNRYRNANISDNNSDFTALTSIKE